VRSPRWVFLLVATMLLTVRSAEAQLSRSMMLQLSIAFAAHHFSHRSPLS
jgi:hypothetical protein